MVAACLRLGSEAQPGRPPGMELHLRRQVGGTNAENSAAGAPFAGRFLRPHPSAGDFPGRARRLGMAGRNPRENPRRLGLRGDGRLGRPTPA